jgi:F-type H+-transporting ATPase subunit O
MLSSRAVIRAVSQPVLRVKLGSRTLPATSYRTYATPASTPDPKPPIALYGLDGTYASALVC